MNKPIVYVRAGHSGIDPKTGLYLTKEDQNAKYFDHKNGKKYHKGSEFWEGESNRAFAAEFIKQGTSSGLHVVPVHHPYLDFSLGEYCTIANDHARKYTTPSSPSIFLDLHSNASNGKARGAFTFYFPGSRQGKKLSDIFAKNLTEYWVGYGSNANRNPSREGWMYNPDGTKKGVYYMLANTNMPSIIVENGFFDNSADADLLMDKEFCVGNVSTMVNSVWEYFMEA